MATLAALRVKLIADIGQFQEAMQKAERTAQQVGKGLRDIGSRLTTRVTLPILGMGAAALKAATDLNAAMANVASLGEEAARNIGTWKTEVQNLAVELGKSTGDLAEGLYQVVSAFGASSESIQILEINAKAAAAGLAQTAESINLTSAVTKAYGDTSAYAVRKVADLALKTVQLGQTTFPELAASIGRVTPLAASLGVRMEELFAVLATATGVTGSAAEVNTQMRAALQALMAPTTDMAKLMKKLGYESGQAMIQELGFVGALQAIVQYAEETGKPLQKFIGSVEGMTLALALSGGLADSFTEKLAAMENAAGAMDEAFAQQTQGINKLGFALAQLRQMVLVTAQRLGDALAPAVLKLVEMVRPWLEKVMAWVERFKELDTRTQAIIVGVVALAAALGPILVLAGMVVSAIGSLAGAVGAILGILGKGVLMVGKWYSMMDKLGKTIPKVMSLHQGFAKTMKGMISALKSPKVAIKGLLGILSRLGIVARALVGMVFNPLTVLIGGIALFALAWKYNWGGIREKVRQAWDNIKKVFLQIQKWVRDELPGVLERLKRTWADTWEKVLPVARAAWLVLMDIAAWAWSEISAIIQLLRKYLPPVFAFVAKIWKTVLAPALGVVLEWVRKALEWFHSLDRETKKRILRVAAAFLFLGVPLLRAARGFGLLVRVGSKMKWLFNLGAPLLRVVRGFGLLVKVGSKLKWLFNIGGVLKGMAAGLVSIGTKIVGLFTGGLAAIKGAVVSVLGAIGPVGWALIALAGIVIGLYLVWRNNWFGMREVIDQVVEQIKAVWGKLVTYWKTVAWPAIQEFGEGLWTQIKPVLEQIARVIGRTLVAAVNALTQYWLEVWQAIQAFWQWASTVLWPWLLRFAGFLAQVVGSAVKMLAWIWKNILWPAIQFWWAWMTKVVIPLLKALAKLARAVVGLALRILAGIWQNVLWPAIQKVVEYITEKLEPVWKRIVDFVREQFIPWLEGLRNTFDRVIGIVQKVIDWINKLADAIANLSLPKWLTPGSPTPFEIGLWGIYDALRKVGRVAMPDFVAAVNLVPEGPPGLSLAMVPAGGGRPVTLNFHYSPVVSLGDEVEAERVLAPLVEATVKRLKAEGVL